MTVLKIGKYLQLYKYIYNYLNNMIVINILYLILIIWGFWVLGNQIAASRSSWKLFLKFSRLCGMFSNTVATSLLTMGIIHLLIT